MGNKTSQEKDKKKKSKRKNDVDENDKDGDNQGNGGNNDSSQRKDDNEQEPSQLTDAEIKKRELKATHRYSVASINTLSSLYEYEKQVEKLKEDLKRIESSVATISNEDRMFESREELLKIKNKLALFLGEVHSFQDKKIDGIQTVELTSGKEEAKAGRKALNKQAEELVENIQALHKETVKLLEMDIL